MSEELLFTSAAAMETWPVDGILNTPVLHKACGGIVSLQATVNIQLAVRKPSVAVRVTVT